MERVSLSQEGVVDGAGEVVVVGRESLSQEGAVDGVVGVGRRH